LTLAQESTSYSTGAVDRVVEAIQVAQNTIPVFSFEKLEVSPERIDLISFLIEPVEYG